MTSKEILERYFNFFIEKGHKQIPNVSLVPEGDATLLFVNSGMFPLVPYLSGEQHPLGKRLINVQRSLRFEDIEEVGTTNRHTVAFHMIGNWSLGDYFKKEQLPWIYEFFIKEMKVDPQRLYATVFAGDESAPKDSESIEIIKEIFKKYGIDAKEGERIFPCGKKDNWWQRGDSVGELGGPDSEIFFYLGEGSAKGKSPNENQDEFLEIGNSVFMQYKKNEEGWVPLSQKNVDFGGGLERIALVIQKKKDIFETDNFWPIIEKIQDITKIKYDSDPERKKAMRVLADHVRACVLLGMDGVTPGNKDQGYILRRILRRMMRVERKLGIEKNISVQLVSVVVDTLGWLYPDLKTKQKEIEALFSAEEEKFGKTLVSGSKELEKRFSLLKNKDEKALSELAFDLFQSLGYPTEIFVEDMEDRGIKLNLVDFEMLVEKRFAEHQSLSRSGSEMKFKGGLADQSETVIKYHTATHLLQYALKSVLGDKISQLGSNITNERLRFDFPFDRKLTEEELNKIEKIINGVVDEKIHVNFVIMEKNEAIKSGANYLKNESYPDQVKVYFIGNSLENALSKEFCGGPHVKNTSELKHIEIFKQESIGNGKMRVYARFK
jgi:alanyl-tRNA synthetase